MRQIAVIVNPHAGHGKARRQCRWLREQVRRSNANVYTETSASGDATALAATAAREGCEVVIVVGGDGTVNEAINGLMRQQNRNGNRPALGVVPQGSANDFARALRLPRSPQDAFRCALEKDTVAIDLGCVTGPSGNQHFFGFSTGIGLVGAVAARRLRTSVLRGASLYIWAAVQCIRTYEQRPIVTVQFDRAPRLEMPLYFLTVNNSPTAGRFPLTPSALMNDGWFDVAYVKTISKARMLYLAAKIRLGMHLHDRDFHMLHARRVSVRAQCSLPLHVDGEIIPSGANSELEIGVLPSALRVVGGRL